MDPLDYWRLCDELTIFQAALLVIELDPAGDNANVEDWKVWERPAGYEAAKSAITNGLRSGAIKGEILPVYWYDRNGMIDGQEPDSVDIKKSRIQVESLRAWLGHRGFSSGFFNPQINTRPAYLDPDHYRYAPKLAAAVNAWLATDDPQATNGRSPKQALVKWLREHAAALGLVDDEGRPNETGIDEIAKVANWQPGGGAPKTPGENPPPP